MEEDKSKIDGTEQAGVSEAGAAGASDAGMDENGDPPYPPTGYAWYVVAALMFVFIFSFIDRQMLSILVHPIEESLGISDQQMSVLGGIAFALFYSFFGIPIARLADTKSRRVIIAIGFFFWSLMTAGHGLVSKFSHLFLLRMGVGVGEAALTPSAHSLITDYFPREKLGLALSVYGLGIYLGSGLAYILGGVLVMKVMHNPTMVIPVFGEIYSWQVIFLLLGIPGMFLVALMGTIKEPHRRGVLRTMNADGTSEIVQAPISELLRFMRANWKTLTAHNLGFSFLAFSSYGTSFWIPTFFNRTHGIEAWKGAIYFGWLIVFFASAGIICGGMLADRMLRQGRTDAKILIGVIAALAWIPVGVVYPLTGSVNATLPFLAGAIFFSGMPTGTSAAAIQEMTPNNLRAQVSAIYIFVVNMIGLGIGPWAVAYIAEDLLGDKNKLNYSILIVTLTAHLGAAIALWLGLKPYRESLERLKTWTAQSPS